MLVIEVLHIGEDTMKRLLLAGTAFLGLAASGSVARATDGLIRFQTHTYTKV